MAARVSSPRHNVMQEYNIVLVGEVGNGKSLFINSFANYLIFPKLEDARTTGVKTVLPFANQRRGADHDVPANLTSQTKYCRSYVFNFKKFRLRIIDSPGLTSADGGTGQDSLDDIIDYIRNFTGLHLIGLVLKSNDTTISPYLRNYLKLILQNFDKTASDNVVIIYTHGETCNYAPISAKEALQGLQDEFRLTLPTFNITLDDPNRVYCFENRGFRYLVEEQMFVEGETGESGSARAWRISWNECNRLLRYVIGAGDQAGIAPHDVNTSYVFHEVRRLVKTIDAIETKETLMALMKNLNDSGARENTGHVIVCHSEVCNKVADIGDGVILHYTQVCCHNCRSLILIRFCSRFSGGRCTVCQCGTDQHRKYPRAQWVREAQHMIDLQDKVIKRLTDVNNVIKNMAVESPMSEDTKAMVAQPKWRFVKYVNDNTMISSDISVRNPPDDVGSMILDEIVQLKREFYSAAPYGQQIRQLLEWRQRHPDLLREVNILFNPENSPFNVLR